MGEDGPGFPVLKGKVVAAALLVTVSHFYRKDGELFFDAILSLVQSACLPITSIGEIATIPGGTYFSPREAIT